MTANCNVCNGFATYNPLHFLAFKSLYIAYLVFLQRFERIFFIFNILPDVAFLFFLPFAIQDMVIVTTISLTFTSHTDKVETSTLSLPDFLCSHYLKFFVLPLDIAMLPQDVKPIMYAFHAVKFPVT